MWEFPGGKLEAGESCEGCLAREMPEEFGIEASVQKFFMNSVYRYGDSAIDLRAYFADWPEQSCQLTVHDEIRWVPAHRLLKHQLAPADVPIARALVEG